MDNNQENYLDIKKMIEHGIFIKLDNEKLKDQIKVKLESMDLSDEMKTPTDKFTFKRLVVNYSFEDTDDNYKKELYTLRVYVTHADIFLNNVSKLAVWKIDKWVVKSYELITDIVTPNPIWRGYFKITLKIGDPPMALGN